MKKLLITGASGFLGWNLCRLAMRDWKVFGVFFAHPVEIPGASTIEADLTDFEHLKTLLYDLRPDAVIHTAAATNPNYCQINKADSRKINVDASLNIASLCAELSVKCAFTSSDLVFDGLNPPYAELDEVSPVSVYGEQKVMAERGMAERCRDLVICRMPLMFGNPGPAAQSFIQPMIEALKEGRELKLFTDEFRTPVSGATAAEGILMALEKINGTIHLGGLERVSRYGFGRLLADALGVEEANLTPCSQEDVPMAAPRPRDVSLDSSKAFSAGFGPEPLRRELKKVLSSSR